MNYLDELDYEDYIITQEEWECFYRDAYSDDDDLDSKFDNELDSMLEDYFEYLFEIAKGK